MADNILANARFIGQRVACVRESGVLPVSTLVERTLPAVLRVQAGEKVLLLTDAPKEKLLEGDAVREARIAMLGRWKAAVERMGGQVEVVVYEETGKNGGPLPQDCLVVANGDPRVLSLQGALSSARIIVAMNEFSATGPLVLAVEKSGGRAVSMPGVTEEMEPAMAVDYTEIGENARRLAGVLGKYSGLEVLFKLAGRFFEFEVDVWGSKWHADDAVCHKPGTVINFPSGETYAAPFEGRTIALGALTETLNIQFGEGSSRWWEVNVFPGTRGDVPLFLGSEAEPIVLHVKRNRIVLDEKLLGVLPEKNRADLARMPGNTNIAEIAFGLNPSARWAPETPTLEREKAFGIHWAHGMSMHLGGIIGPDEADVHQDYVYSANDARFKITVTGLYVPDKEPKSQTCRETIMEDGRLVV